MANISGFLGRTGNYTNDIIGLNNFQNEWIKAAQDKGITIAGKTSTTFNGTDANLSLLNFSTNPAQNLNNLALTNLNQAGNDTFASILGIGVADSYDGWYTSNTKIRAEINHNPNNGESQELIFKWADNQNITSTTIELSALSPKTPGGEQGNEVGFLQLYNNGALVSPTNFTIARLNAPLNQKPITISPNGITLIGDRTDGSFKFKIDAIPGSGFSFDELRFSAKAYDSPTSTYQNTIFKQDSSDYLVRNISYQGTEDTPVPIVTITASDANAAETDSPIAPNPGQFTFTRTGSTASPLTVNYAIAGTADNGSDYSLIGNSITFAAGQSSVTLPINIINDTVVEGAETVNLTLAANSAYTVGAANTATVNIADNDTAIDPFVSTGSPSGNSSTNALLSPEVFYWNTSLNGGKITYSFLSDAGAGSYYGSETVSELSDPAKDNVRSILTSLESSLNVDFVEVQDSATNYGVLRYMFSDGPSSVGAYAYAYYPYSNTDELSGDVHFSANFESDPNRSFSGSPGNFGYQTIIHETFHALGLKHPFDDSPTLPAQEDNNTNTVMTYNDDPPYAGSYAITPMAYDLRSLQYLYGAKSNNSGNTTYSFSSVYGYTVNGQFNGSSTTPIKQSLWDSNGSDSLDFSSLPVDNYRFDMNQGGILTTQAAYNASPYRDYVTGDTYNTSSFGTTLAYNTTIEKLINSPGNDEIIANAAANSFGGYNPGNFTGDDVFKFANALDVLDLSGYSLSDLSPTVSGSDLNIDLGLNGSLAIQDYYGSGGSMKIAVAGNYYTYNAGTGWQVAPAPAIPAASLEQPSDGLTSTPASPYDSPFPLPPVFSSNVVNI